MVQKRLQSFIMRAMVGALLFLTMQSCDVTGSGCQGDRNEDHRPRVSCVNQGLTALPGGIEPLTQVLVLKGNRLTSLSWSDYSAFTHLYELDLSHNDITALEPPGKTSHAFHELRTNENHSQYMINRVVCLTAEIAEACLCVSFRSGAGELECVASVRKQVDWFGWRRVPLRSQSDGDLLGWQSDSFSSRRHLQ